MAWKGRIEVPREGGGALQVKRAGVEPLLSKNHCTGNETNFKAQARTHDGPNTAILYLSITLRSLEDKNNGPISVATQQINTLFIISSYNMSNIFQYLTIIFRLFFFVLVSYVL
jgi:hypothetical protein